MPGQELGRPRSIDRANRLERGDAHVRRQVMRGDVGEIVERIRGPVLAERSRREVSHPAVAIAERATQGRSRLGLHDPAKRDSNAGSDAWRSVEIAPRSTGSARASSMSATCSNAARRTDFDLVPTALEHGVSTSGIAEIAGNPNGRLANLRVGVGEQRRDRRLHVGVHREN